MITLLRERRSIRAFTHQKIDDHLLKILQEACLRSPTSKNRHPWHFIFVTNKETLTALSLAKPNGSAFLAGAPLGVVICADPNKSDVWVEDCSIASVLLQMVAQEHHLGSCWIQIRKRMNNDHLSSEEYVKGILKLPPHLRVEAIIAIGHPNENRPPVPQQALQYDRITQID